MAVAPDQLPPPDVLAKAHLLAYIGLQWPQYGVANLHRKLADVLMRVERGELRRVIIEVPPQHGKTQQVGGFFPPWYLGRNPDHQIIYTTYAQDRADDVGRQVRNYIRDPVHYRVFGQHLTADSQAVHRFSVTTRPDGHAQGGYFAVGRGGPVTGRGADGLIIDDPIKNRQEADSEAVQRELRDWYSSVLYTRLRPWSFVVLMMTRWALDDLAGWLQAMYPHEKWYVLRLPALVDGRIDLPDPLGRKAGEALWPERYGAEWLRHVEKTVMPRDWLAMYQQRPTLAEGTHFKREWFDRNRYPKLPERLHWYGASDFAVSSGGGDSTELALFGVDTNMDIYVADWWHGKVSPDVWIEAMMRMMVARRPLGWFSESGVIRKATEPFIRRRMQDTGVYTALTYITRTQDKLAMAQPIIGRAAQGKVRFPANAAWADRVINQLCNFTGSGNEVDDAVDTMAHMGLALDAITGAPGIQHMELGPKPFTPDWLMYDEKARNKPRNSKW